jgi:glycolate oxidase iron-sulfur subunit
MLRPDPFEELSKCVRCGSCKAFCPTYDDAFTEAMGARGRLALLWGLSSGKLSASPALNDRIFSCTLCGICSGSCPSGIDIKEIFYHGRSVLRKTDKKRRLLRFLTRFATKRPVLCFRLLTMTQNFVFPYLYKKGVLPFKPDLSEYQLRDKQKVYTVTKKKGRVAVFTGCTINFLFPHLGESLIHVLHRLGYEVILPVGEACCGVPLRSLGLDRVAKELAQKNLELFNRLNVEAVISLCPTCTLAIKNEYPKLIGEGIEKAVDVSLFLMDKLEISQFQLTSSHMKRALFHDPCHLKYGLGIEKEPRTILKNIGMDLQKTEGEHCCGFAGTFSFTHRDLSQNLLDKCLLDYSQEGSEMIITACPGCMIQLSKGDEKKPVLHVIEVIEEAMLHHS